MMHDPIVAEVRVVVRERSYELRGSESRTLATVGAFRVVSTGDLRDHVDRPANWNTTSRCIAPTCDPQSASLGVAPDFSASFSTTYRHLFPLVAGLSDLPPGAEEGERVGERPSARPRPPWATSSIESTDSLNP